MSAEPIKKMKETIDEFSKIIPEIFFDIICRVVPGIIFVTVFITATPISLTWKWYYDLPVMVAVAYSIGLTLDCFSSRLLYPLSMYWSWKAVHSLATEPELDELKKLVKTGESGVSEEEKWEKKERRIMLESLRSEYMIKNPSEKAILIKMLAEEAFFRVMALGLPISVIFFPLNEVFPDCWEGGRGWDIVLLAVVEIVFFVCIYDRMQRTVTRTFSWWRHKER